MKETVHAAAALKVIIPVEEVIAAVVAVDRVTTLPEMEDTVVPDAMPLPVTYMVATMPVAALSVRVVDADEAVPVKDRGAE